MGKKAYHGGDFFKAVGEDFSDLGKGELVVNADVLDAWFPPSPAALGKIREFLPYLLRTSPPTHAEGLIATIAERRGIPTSHIAVAGGSSDLMMVLFPALLRARDTVMILDPTYGEYQHIFENVLDVALVRHSLARENGFRVDVAALAREIGDVHPSMVVMVNPNNPTGKHVLPEEVIGIIKAIPEDILFVVDEAYIEYVSRDRSLERFVVEHPNLIILKSMSKGYALSGARVGYVVAVPEIIEKVSMLIPPWPVSLVGQVAAVEALRDDVYYDGRYREVAALRTALIKDVESIPRIAIHDSCANFFLVDLSPGGASAAAVTEALRKENIFIRNCDSMSPQFNDDFIRIAVRDRATNERIAAALKRELAGKV